MDNASHSGANASQKRAKGEPARKRVKGDVAKGLDGAPKSTPNWVCWNIAAMRDQLKQPQIPEQLRTDLDALLSAMQERKDLVVYNTPSAAQAEQATMLVRLYHELISPPGSHAATKSSLPPALSERLAGDMLRKQDELRELQKQLAKCDVSLEQLRRVSIVPYPGYDRALAEASNNVGPLVETPEGYVMPQYPQPWNIPQSPYTRHYQKWLIPDPRFDPAVMVKEQTHVPLGGRMTRNSQTAALTNLADPNAGATVAQEDPNASHRDPMIMKNSRGEWVKLSCSKCDKNRFRNIQGFLNHYRLAHKWTYPSQLAAADENGVPVEDIDASLYEDAPKTTSKPLARSIVPPPPLITPSTGLGSMPTPRIFSPVTVVTQTHRRPQAAEPFAHPFNTPDGDQRAAHHRGRSQRDPNVSASDHVNQAPSASSDSESAALSYLAQRLGSREKLPNGCPRNLQQLKQMIEMLREPVPVDSDSDDDGTQTPSKTAKGSKNGKARMAQSSQSRGSHGKVKSNITTSARTDYSADILDRPAFSGMGLPASQARSQAHLEHSVATTTQHGASENGYVNTAHAKPTATLPMPVSYFPMNSDDLSPHNEPDMVSDRGDDDDFQPEPTEPAPPSPTGKRVRVRNDAEDEMQDGAQEPAHTPAPKRARGRPKKTQDTES
ncbi:hypothetical protein NA57DRAFT_54861 [Rhizodiscina lignyota]|uniref:AHC1-like C2H2 zinc-finger domain-containing protein n=1 Tax=Rhizodiscina lignyota TaxID=1504668 RepID=A0A9P4IK47_9PEZI|nr:hypothetical protein NA57DRAFT_54861 [Rhizodiscina lignyota]